MQLPAQCCAPERGGAHGIGRFDDDFGEVGAHELYSSSPAGIKRYQRTASVAGSVDMKPASEPFVWFIETAKIDDGAVPRVPTGGSRPLGGIPSCRRAATPLRTQFSRKTVRPQ